MTEREYFIEACFAADLQAWYKQWIADKKDRIQFFFSTYQTDGIYEHYYWSPSKICSSSGQELTRDNINIKSGYWTPHLWKPIHKDLHKEAKAFETIECQKIDADCNDCKHYVREKELGIGISAGHCMKFDKPTKGYVNVCSGRACFEHRRK